MFNTFLTTLIISTAYAAEYTPNLENPLGNSDLSALVERFTNFLLNFAVVVVPIVIIWGAFQMLTSAGQTEKWQSGKKAILYAVIGLIVVLMAKGIAAAIKTAITGTA